jgi:cell division protein FtsL
MVKQDEALVFRKTSFYITTALTLLVMIVSIVTVFATVSVNVDSNAVKIEENACDIKDIQQQLNILSRIEYNLKNLCEKQDVKYIE